MSRRRNESEWMFSDNFRVNGIECVQTFRLCSAQTFWDSIICYDENFIELKCQISGFSVIFLCTRSSVQTFLFQLWKCCERRRWMLGKFQFQLLWLFDGCQLRCMILMFILILLLCNKRFMVRKWFRLMRRRQCQIRLANTCNPNVSVSFARR